MHTLLYKNRVVKSLNFFVVPLKKSKKKKREYCYIKVQKYHFWQVLNQPAFYDHEYVKICIFICCLPPAPLPSFGIELCPVCCWKHQQSCKLILTQSAIPPQYEMLPTCVLVITLNLGNRMWRRVASGSFCGPF